MYVLIHRCDVIFVFVCASCFHECSTSHPELVAALHGAPSDSDLTGAHVVFQRILRRCVNETKKALQNWGRRDSPVRRAIRELSNTFEQTLLEETLVSMATGESRSAWC